MVGKEVNGGGGQLSPASERVGEWGPERGFRWSRAEGEGRLPMPRPDLDGDDERERRGAW